MELATSTESWRSGRPDNRTARYLSFLRDHTGTVDVTRDGLRPLPGCPLDPDPPS